MSMLTMAEVTSEKAARMYALSQPKDQYARPDRYPAMPHVMKNPCGRRDDRG
jgi:hypothetical protein